MSTLGVCTGQCCAVFPLSATRDEIAGRGDDSGEFSLISSMVFNLTHAEAIEHLNALSMAIPEWVDGSSRPLYSCRQWDSQSRRCTIYEQRPRMCRLYPYSAACEFCGYRHPDLYREPEPRVEDGVGTAERALLAGSD